MSDTASDEEELPDDIEPEGWEHGHPGGRVVANGLLFDEEGRVVGAQVLAYLPPRNAISTHGDGTGQAFKFETPMSEFHRSAYFQCWGRKHLLVTVEVLDDEQLAQYQEHQRSRGETPAPVVKGKRSKASSGTANGSTGGAAAPGGQAPARRIIEGD